MLKDQIISLFMLFKVLKPGGIFVIEEIDFPEKKLDMRQDQHPPDLKSRTTVDGAFKWITKFTLLIIQINL